MRHSTTIDSRSANFDTLPFVLRFSRPISTNRGEVGSSSAQEHSLEQPFGENSETNLAPSIWNFRDTRYTRVRTETTDDE
jgi:hypothetical protein